ncbi:hypothetical protein DFH06DRAFT_1122286 [Mycena polygramma]|nr:hypothetical protein DFH06DRAFT_1122286 [Mycena polygramma]
MKVNTAKSSSSRYSPLVVRDTNRPLRRPRKASQDTINKKTTARLFASSVPEYEAPLSGYGALCSQVGETQFFAQFGTDVALPVANAWSPVSSPAASPTSSPSIKTPPLSPSKQPASSPLKQYGSRIRGYIPGQPQHIDFRPAPWHLEDPFTGPQDMDLDPWPLDAEGNTVRPDYLDDDFLAGTAQPSWEEMHPSVKIEEPQEQVQLLVRENRAWQVHQYVECAGLISSFNLLHRKVVGLTIRSGHGNQKRLVAVSSLNGLTNYFWLVFGLGTIGVGALVVFIIRRGEIKSLEDRLRNIC